MNITPCRTCHLAETCSIKKDKIKGVRGLHLTAIKFKCAVLAASLLPGMKVRADLRYVTYGHGYEGEPLTRKQTVDAIIMGWSKDGKVRIFVPYGDEDWWLSKVSDNESLVHVVKVEPRQIHPSAEFVSVCKDCGLPEEAELSDWHCANESGCYDFTRPANRGDSHVTLAT